MLGSLIFIAIGQYAFADEPLFGCEDRQFIAAADNNQNAESQQPETGFADLSEDEIMSLISGLGKPVDFDSLYQKLNEMPAVKDEFETTKQFQERQASVLASLEDCYLIEAQVDMEYVKYDADSGVLVVATYALTNTLASADELSAVFGYGSKLRESGIEIEYSSLGTSNVMWAMPRERSTIGTYDATNLYGVTVSITQQAGVSRGVFEREGSLDENVWAKERKPAGTGSQPVAFEIVAEPERAKALKRDGLRAAVVIKPRSPYCASGVDRFLPTVQAPYDRTTEVRYIIADIQCVVVYDSEYNVLSYRVTQ